MIIGSKGADSWESEVKIGTNSMRNIDKEDLLGEVLNNHLKFGHHIKKMAGPLKDNFG